MQMDYQGETIHPQLSIMTTEEPVLRNRLSNNVEKSIPERRFRRLSPGCKSTIVNIIVNLQYWYLLIGAVVFFHAYFVHNYNVNALVMSALFFVVLIFFLIYVQHCKDSLNNRMTLAMVQIIYQIAGNSYLNYFYCY